MVGDAEGPALRVALLNVCSELFGPAFSGSEHEDVMLLADDKRFHKVELAGALTDHQTIRPFSSLNELRFAAMQRMRQGHRRRRNRAKTNAFASMSGIE